MKKPDLQKYLSMQKKFYDEAASKWSLNNKNPVVGSYNAHNLWKDYDDYLFRFNTSGMVALEYGCGPGRNLIRFSNKFLRIDGVDISEENLQKAKINLTHNGIDVPNLLVCDGKSIPFDDESYDVVFSVICLQHIACWSIRKSIFEETHRVLKKDGKFCFQMGYGGKKNKPTSDYHADSVDAKGTNGRLDVAVLDQKCLEKDLSDCGFSNYISDIRPVGPGDDHANWIWVEVTK
ncbi:MAG: class I SAM-dependent methyltransferase [Candidimonas sp.]